MTDSDEDKTRLGTLDKQFTVPFPEAEPELQGISSIESLAIVEESLDSDDHQNFLAVNSTSPLPPFLLSVPEPVVGQYDEKTLLNIEQKIEPPFNPSHESETLLFPGSTELDLSQSQDLEQQNQENQILKKSSNGITHNQSSSLPGSIDETASTSVEVSQVSFVADEDVTKRMEKENNVNPTNQNPSQLETKANNDYQVITTLQQNDKLGKFRVVRPLGEGGMGAVYKVVDENLEKKNLPNPIRAVKVLSKSLPGYAIMKLAFDREWDITHKMEHINIIRVYDPLEDSVNNNGVDVFNYFSMDYLEGRSLKEIIKEHELAGKGMSFDQAWPIIKQTADALNHVHEKAYVHRDIKPANIFLTNEGVIKLLDFGISLRRDLTNSSDATNYIGQGISLPWAAYEHISQFTTPDIRDDIYSLAYVVYQLLTAKHPFQGKHAVEVKSEREQNKLPKELTKPDNVQLTDAQWKALKWGLELQRDNRPTNISEWLAEFGSKQVSRSSFKLSYKFLAAGLVSLLLVIGVWFGFVKNYSGNDDAASVELKKQTEVEKTIPVSPPPLPVVVQEPIYISILDNYPSIPNFNYTFNKDGYLSVVIKDVKAARENKKEVLFFIYPANQDIDVSLNSQNVDLKGGVIDPFEYRNKLRREQGKRPLELESGEYEVLTFFSSNPLSSYKETFDESRNVRESVLTNSNVYYKNNKINIFNRNVLKK